MLLRPLNRIGRSKAFTALGAVLLLSALSVITVSGSSHREAPDIANDPQVDATDLYAFVDPNDPSKVNLIANYYPVQDPAGGPNFYRFADNAVYQIHIDNDGDAKPDITYQWEFETHIRNDDTFLYNTGPVTSLDDPDLNIRQTYKVLRIEDGHSEDLANGLVAPPSNVGPKSMPDYEDLAWKATYELDDDVWVFAGQRDDPFYIDIGASFDLLNIRELPGSDSDAGVDGLSGFNVQTLAIQVPIEDVTDGDPVIGVWTTSARPSMRILNPGGGVEWQGENVQVSRLGNPLVNELIIPLEDKDSFNASYPKDDANFLGYVQSPLPAAILNLLYGDILEEIPEEDRADLVTVYLTGIPGLNQPENITPSEMLRLNTSIAPSDDPHRLGVLGGDNAGFPNGRRPMDDVTDISLQAVACGYDIDPCDTLSPNGQLGDGVQENDKDFLNAFPYLAMPHSGFEHEHDHGGDD